MSLKAFHIFFIIVSVLLSLGFAVWEFQRYGASNDALQLVAGLFAIGAAVGLVLYGIRFMHKLKHVGLI